jgi:hypothetical protein
VVDELGRADLVYEVGVTPTLDFVDEATDQGLVILGGHCFLPSLWVGELVDSMMPPVDT